MHQDCACCRLALISQDKCWPVASILVQLGWNCCFNLAMGWWLTENNHMAWASELGARQAMQLSNSLSGLHVKILQMHGIVRPRR